jgi:hypothetical protein
LPEVIDEQSGAIRTAPQLPGIASDILIYGILIWSQVRSLSPASDRVDQLQVGAWVRKLADFDVPAGHTLSLDPEDAELWFRKAVVHRHGGSLPKPNNACGGY